MTAAVVTPMVDVAAAYEPLVIEHKRIKRWGACDAESRQYREMFPRGVPITVEAGLQSIERSLQTFWVTCMLPSSMKREVLRTMVVSFMSMADEIVARYPQGLSADDQAKWDDLMYYPLDRHILIERETAREWKERWRTVTFHGTGSYTEQDRYQGLPIVRIAIYTRNIVTSTVDYLVPTIHPNLTWQESTELLRSGCVSHGNSIMGVLSEQSFRDGSSRRVSQEWLAERVKQMRTETLQCLQSMIELRRAHGKIQ